MTTPATHKPRRDLPFFLGLWTAAGLFLLLIIALVTADAAFISLTDIKKSLAEPAIRTSVILTLITCTLSAALSLLVAVPAGYLLSRTTFPGKRLVDAIFDIPIVLPPVVVGLSLLILFEHVDIFGQNLDAWVTSTFSFLTDLRPGLTPGVTYKVSAVILAQFTVAAAFAVRVMRGTFDQLSPRQEQVALTLGCNRSQAFWAVALPASARGVATAGTLAWARSLGEFGPVLVFAGAVSGRTEVMATTVFLELSLGNITGAVTVSLLMVAVAITVIIAVRTIGDRPVFST